jgi:hypothetical protein
VRLQRGFLMFKQPRVWIVLLTTSVLAPGIGNANESRSKRITERKLQASESYQAPKNTSPFISTKGATIVTFVSGLAMVSGALYLAGNSNDTVGSQITIGALGLFGASNLGLGIRGMICQPWNDPEGKKATGICTRIEWGF